MRCYTENYQDANAGQPQANINDKGLDHYHGKASLLPDLQFCAGETSLLTKNFGICRVFKAY